jgi:hypothetical protein
MHLPELPLLSSGQRGLGCRGRVLVEREWVMLKDDADIITINIKNLLDGREDS